MASNFFIWQVSILKGKSLVDVLLGAGSGPGISRLWVSDLCHLKGKQLSFHLEKRRWQRKGFIVSLGMENKNFLQKLLKDDCIYWRLKLVFEDKRVLRKDFGNVLKYVDREYWNGRLN